MAVSYLRQLRDDLYDATARIERIVLLAGTLDPGGISEDLENLLDSDLADLRALFPDMPEWLDECYASDINSEFDEAFTEWAQEFKLGFVVKMATPVMTHGKGGSATYSWGYYNTTWVYANDLETAILKGLEWVAARRLAEKQKGEKE